MDTGCMELTRTGPNTFPTTFVWCGRLPVDERSAPGTPRCTEHLTADTMRPDAELNR